MVILIGAIRNWNWFGLYRSEGSMNAYTYGMDVFGKDEMEVLNADAEPGDLRVFIRDELDGQLVGPRALFPYSSSRTKLCGSAL